MIDQNKTKIIGQLNPKGVVGITTSNGTLVTIHDDGTVKIMDTDNVVVYDSSNPNNPPPPPSGH